MNRETLQTFLDAAVSSRNRYRRDPTENAIRGELKPHQLKELLADPLHGSKGIGHLSHIHIVDLVVHGCLRPEPARRGRRTITRYKILRHQVPDRTDGVHTTTNGDTTA